jgi:hypothetical protein
MPIALPVRDGKGCARRVPNRFPETQQRLAPIPFGHGAGTQRVPALWTIWILGIEDLVLVIFLCFQLSFPYVFLATVKI